MNSRILVSITMLVVLAVTALTAYWLGSRVHPPAAASASAAASEKVALYWYDPMVPDQHFDKPGKSPFMDMDLVPKYAGTDDANTVQVSAATVQNLGVRTQRVEVGQLASALRVPGSINWDLRAARELSARVDGVVDKLFVRAAFEPVRKGQALAELIAPVWSAAAQEYLALETLQSADARELRVAARNRLRVLGMGEAQIRSLRSGATGITLRAPADGVVGELSVREGQSVQAGMSLMRINGLDTVWAEAAIPQAQSVGVRPGMAVSAIATAFPGEIFNGTVEILLAQLDSATRTQRARIVLDNPGHRLLPGMFVELSFAEASGASHPLVADSALISSGTDTRVIIESSPGHFAPMRVVTGRSVAGQTEILKGLSGGEQVVISGQFMIDSEASLSGALDRLSSPQAGEPMQHDMHEGHEMPAEADPHQSHAMPDPPDPHQGHDMPAPADPHQGHEMPAQPDPHQGHEMPTSPARDVRP